MSHSERVIGYWTMREIMKGALQTWYEYEGQSFLDEEVAYITEAFDITMAAGLIEMGK